MLRKKKSRRRAGFENVQNIGEYGQTLKRKCIMSPS